MTTEYYKKGVKNTVTDKQLIRALKKISKTDGYEIAMAAVNRIEELLELRVNDMEDMIKALEAPHVSREDIIKVIREYIENDCK